MLRFRYRLASVAAVGIFVALVSVAVTASTLFEQVAAAPADPRLQQDFLQWAVTQGGLTMALLAVLWFYRRDFLRAARQEVAAEAEHRERAQRRVSELSSQLNMVVNIVQTSTALHERVVNATQKQEETISRLADALQNFECVFIDEKLMADHRRKNRSHKGDRDDG